MASVDEHSRFVGNSTYGKSVVRGFPSRNYLHAVCIEFTLQGTEGAISDQRLELRYAENRFLQSITRGIRVHRTNDPITQRVYDDLHPESDFERDKPTSTYEPTFTTAELIALFLQLAMTRFLH